MRHGLEVSKKWLIWQHARVQYLYPIGWHIALHENHPKSPQIVEEYTSPMELKGYEWTKKHIFFTYEKLEGLPRDKLPFSRWFKPWIARSLRSRELPGILGPRGAGSCRIIVWLSIACRTLFGHVWSLLTIDPTCQLCILLQLFCCFRAQTDLALDDVDQATNGCESGWFWGLLSSAKRCNKCSVYFMSYDREQ